jgi:protein-tyrosine phosphatase
MNPYLTKKNSQEKIVEILFNLYAEMVSLFKPVLKDIFKTLSNEESYPVLLFCSAGRDRTGFLTALIMHVLGIAQNQIIADYLHSNDKIVEQATKVLNFMKILTFGWFPAENLMLSFTAKKEYIQHSFHIIETEFGSFEAYLDECGVDTLLIPKIRKILILSKLYNDSEYEQKS